MKKLMLGTAIVLSASSAAYAQDYQAELGIGYLDGDLENVDFDGYGLNAKVHLDKVDTSKGPLNEAAFLDKSSSIELTWITLELDGPGSSSADVDTIGLDGRFVTKDNLILEASYTDIDADTGTDETVLGIGIGTYINDHMDVVVSYEDFDEADFSSLSVDAHGLNPLQSDSALAYDLGISYLDADDDSGYALRAGADYYFNKAFSLGAGLELASVDDEDESTLNVRTKYFVTPVVSLELEYESLGQDSDGDTIFLSASARF